MAPHGATRYGTARHRRAITASEAAAAAVAGGRRTRARTHGARGVDDLQQAHHLDALEVTRAFVRQRFGYFGHLVGLWQALGHGRPAAIDVVKPLAPARLQQDCR